MPTVPESSRDLFEKATVAHVTTMLPNGMSHWVDHDTASDRLLVSPERETRKAANVERDPRVASILSAVRPWHSSLPRGVESFHEGTADSMSTVDPDDTARVETVTTEGGHEHIDSLARRYAGGVYSEPVWSERVLLRTRATEFTGPWHHVGHAHPWRGDGGEPRPRCGARGRRRPR